MPITEIQRSAEGYIANPHPNGETPFEEFWVVRSRVLAGTSPFGKTGPDDGSDSPDFWLVEDQLNHERYQLGCELAIDVRIVIFQLKSLGCRSKIDHVSAEKHGGSSDADNLALSCYYCNSFKGPNIAGIDPEGDPGSAGFALV